MERLRTDFFFVAFFAAMLVAVLAIIIYGLAAGNVWGLASPFDAAGNLCGNKFEQEDSYYKWTALPGESCVAIGVPKDSKEDEMTER